jgi:hypothetical protein
MPAIATRLSEALTINELQKRWRLLAKQGYEKLRFAYTERQKAFAIRANAIRERAAKRTPTGERERLVAAN